MLSYRHAFHAGNHADVLKHIVLMECLRLLQRKEKGFLAADTHAGAGAYALEEGYAAQNREWSGGIARLRGTPSTEPPRAVAEYLAYVDGFSAAARPGLYPGSPEIIAGLLRPQDRAVFCELHPADHQALEERFGPARYGRDRSVRVRRTDGFAELKAILPPPSRRALVFIDPSYELAADYGRVVESLRDCLKRFAEGVYLVWYPLLEREEARLLPDRLDSIAPRPTLRAELRMMDLPAGARGMAGSGLFVINPPWTLEETLREILPFLAAALGSTASEAWKLTPRAVRGPDSQ
jgi:23S rRNA (adenine2030-N6)-methyltransferase